MATDNETDIRIAKLRGRLAAIDNERSHIVAELGELKRLQATVPDGKQIRPPLESTTAASVTMSSSTSEKINLFRSLFRGREDVFPNRWENAKTGKAGYSPDCRNEWVRGICEKPKIKCGACPHQAFVPVSDDIIRRHLQGNEHRGTMPNNLSDFTVGVYPILPNETCWFLAVDFDKNSWARDARAFLGTCRERRVPVALERSRSGNGCHVWIFFAEPVLASEARRLGSFLITATMEHRPDIGFDSYDRFFPSQDTTPVGGFGNLIALPLQSTPRRHGNSVFLDDDMRPYEDQWAFLASVRRMARIEVGMLIEMAAVSGQILGVGLPGDDEDDKPWTAPPSRRRPEAPITGQIPDRLKIVLGSQIYIDRTQLPSGLVNRMIRLASFQNPEFYSAQAMRLSTFGKPRIISCAELFPKHVALPRGSLDAVLTLLSEFGVTVDLQDERNAGTELDVKFLGELTDQQQAARDTLLKHDFGVLAATTAFGKTVVAAHIIAARRRNTLVLVHRRQLLDQWVDKLSAFLDIDPKKIGVIKGGKRKPTGQIDVASLQSLMRKGEVSDLVANYGQLVFDECHHLSAVSFEAIAREAKAKFVLGLSATLTRKDGHHPIIFMQCGPVRYRVDARKQANMRPFSHKFVVRKTAFRQPQSENESIKIQALYGLIAQDQARDDLIFNDVLLALEAGRSPVVITERKDHLSILATRFSRFAKNVIALHGGMSVRQRKETMTALHNVPDHEERVLIATGRYLGEGFDDARLDTLFLTMPISWRGTLAQYAGRLHRLHPNKREVIIYDYVDSDEPVLARMATKRRTGYRNLGYVEIEDIDTIYQKTS